MHGLSSLSDQTVGDRPERRIHLFSSLLRLLKEGHDLSEGVRGEGGQKNMALGLHIISNQLDAAYNRLDDGLRLRKLPEITTISSITERMIYKFL